MISKKQKIISSLLKIIIIAAAVTGIILSEIAGERNNLSGGKVFMYFTIQSNIFLALICLAGLYMIHRKQKISSAWYVIKLTATLSITLTGAVFCFVLAPSGVKWDAAGLLTHALVPLCGILDFFVTAISADIRKRNVFWVTLPPVLYTVYAGIGYISKWEFADGGIYYPYFFLNWGSKAGAFGFIKEPPFMGTGWWIAALSLFLILTGLLYLFIVDVIKKVIKNKSDR